MFSGFQGYKTCGLQGLATDHVLNVIGRHGRVGEDFFAGLFSMFNGNC